MYRIRCHLVYIWTYFKDTFIDLFETCPRSVNKFRTNFFLRCWRMFGVLNGPPPPPPSPASMSKFPSGGKIWKNGFTMMFFIFIIQIQKDVLEWLHIFEYILYIYIYIYIYAQMLPASDPSQKTYCWMNRVLMIPWTQAQN